MPVATLCHGQMHTCVVRRASRLRPMPRWRTAGCTIKLWTVAAKAESLLARAKPTNVSFDDACGAAGVHAPANSEDNLDSDGIQGGNTCKLNTIRIAPMVTSCQVAKLCCSNECRHKRRAVMDGSP